MIPRTLMQLSFLITHRCHLFRFLLRSSLHRACGPQELSLCRCAIKVYRFHQDNSLSAKICSAQIWRHINISKTIFLTIMNAALVKDPPFLQRMSRRVFKHSRQRHSLGLVKQRHDLVQLLSRPRKWVMVAERDTVALKGSAATA